MRNPDPEPVEKVYERFQDVDEAVRQRAARRIAEGADAQSALADETTAAQLVKAYTSG